MLERARLAFMVEVNRRCVPNGEHLTTEQWRALIAKIAAEHGVDAERLRRRIY